ncbi:MAG: bepE 2 [Gammaproteobacteria bacterium]|jgi:multidrug efflux pump|nr:bepE 2 [Gammaproteobacteria bacterium]
MQFTDTFIRRPVFATVLSLILILIGVVSFNNMTLRQYPQIEVSTIQVYVGYPGANAALMEGFVTTPLENAISSVDGIDYMVSSSKSSVSTLTIYLKQGYDINVAITDVMNQISSVRGQLPTDVDDPVVSKVDPSARPTMYIAFDAPGMNQQEVTDYLIRVVQPQMQIVEGVGQAQILGDREYAMRINLDPKRMAAHNLTAIDVQTALQQNNLQSAAGTLKAAAQQFDVIATTDLNTPEQFNNLVIQHDNSHLIRLRDVGNAELGALEYDGFANVNGKETVVIGIIPKSTANPLSVSKAIQALLPELQTSMPEGMQATVLYDSSEFIKDSIKEVYKTILEAGFLVILVIFLFIGDLRTIFVPIVTIPLSLIGVCGYMYAMGYSINTLTLLAWVLAIGLVVDDAIVVLENIHRHIEEGMPPFQAAIKGAREIGFAIIAMTFTLAAVYVPIGFTSGMVGTMFREFSFTLAGAVIVSGFVALTLSPMMCAKFMASGLSTSGFAHKIDSIFTNLMQSYKGVLTKVIDKRKWVLIGGGLIYLSCYFLYAHLPDDLAPIEDQGVLYAQFIGPTAANIQYMKEYSDEIQNVYNAIPEKKNYGIFAGFGGTNYGFSFLTFKDDRKRASWDILRAINPQLKANPGLIIQAFPPPSLPSASMTPVSFVLNGSVTTEELNNYMQKLITQANKNPGFRSATTDLLVDSPQLSVNIDRDRAGIMGVSMADIASVLNLMMGEPNSIMFDMRNRSYYVVPEFINNFNYNNEPSQINNYYVKNDSGTTIPFSTLVTVEKKVVPQSLNHFQQMPSATLNATLSGDYTQGEALNFLSETAKRILPSTIHIDYSGQSRQTMQASSAMTQAMIFAVIFIFLVLAAQFESYRDPLIVMSTVLLSVAGALFVLNIIPGNSLNIYSKIGLITLVGLISKHGILIVEFANQLQAKQGLSIHDAAIESASLRLRPILMTTAAMVLGAVPLAIASGAGANARHQIGFVIVGGMTFGTLFSLFVVPVIYTLFAKKHEKDNFVDPDQIDQHQTLSH